MLTLDKQEALRAQYRQTHPQWQPATAHFEQLARHFLTPTSRLLDLGCGRGGVIEQLQHTLTNTVGIDPDWQSLATHRLPALPRVVGSSERLPFAGNTFDVVLAGWVLEHLSTPLRDLQEIVRILRPEGVFILMTPNKRHPLIRLNQYLGRLSAVQTRLVWQLYGRKAEDTFPAHYRANTPHDIQVLADKVGLFVERFLVIPDPSYWGVLPAIYPLLCRLEQYIPVNAQLHLVGVLRKK